MFRIFHPCKLVPRIHVSHFQSPRGNVGVQKKHCPAFGQPMRQLDSLPGISIDLVFCFELHRPHTERRRGPFLHARSVVLVSVGHTGDLGELCENG